VDGQICFASDFHPAGLGLTHTGATFSPKKSTKPPSVPLISESQGAL